MKVQMISSKNKKRKVAVLTEQEKEYRKSLSERLCSKVTFPSCVYSYIKGKSAKKAIAEIKREIHRYKYFMKFDIEDYFNSVDTDILFKIIDKKISDKILADDLKETIEFDKKSCNSNGIILGSPLSNHLSNLYLIDFDEKFNSNNNMRYFRFCDDMLFLYNDKNEIEEVENEIKKLNLSFNTEKLQKGQPGDSFKFLGEVINTTNEFNVSTQEEILELFTKNKNKSNNDNKFESFKQWVFNELDKEYEYVFRYYFNGEDKESLIEEMLDENLYKQVYIFEDALEILCRNVTMYDIFVEKFLHSNTCYYVTPINEKVDYKRVNSPIDSNIFEGHINGDYTLAINLNYDGKSKILVLDIDNKSNIKKARDLAYIIYEELEKRDVMSYIEFSGNKGYHLWILFDDFINVAQLNEYIEDVLQSLNIKRNAVEIIPKYNKMSDTQEIIKLPLGIHPATKNKSYFLNITSIKEINTNKFRNNRNILEEFWKNTQRDFKEIYNIADKCSILKRIIEYGILNGTINHFNRLVLTYVFPQLQNGNEFIHYLMEQLDNYSHNITEKYINKAPDNAISCKKLKDYFKNTDFQCLNCKFNIVGMYDSPILHSENEETLFLSSKIQVKNIIEDIIKLQQERKEITSNLRKLEKKLDKLYETFGGEGIEIPMGKLNKNNDKWIIEIEV